MLNMREVMAPQSLDEALACLQNKNSIPLAAGTDIIPQMRDGLLKDVSLVDLHYLSPQLGGIHMQQGCLHIGAMATHAQIARHPDVLVQIPMLAYACNLVGSAQIRNRATIGGNIGNASPAADSVPVLVAADAQVVFLTVEGEQTLPLCDFLVAPRRTKLPHGGLITKIIVPIPDGGWKGGYYKVGGRTALTIAIVSCALLYNKKSGFCVAYGSMSASVKRLPTLEAALLEHQPPTQEDLQKAAGACMSPISDVRASAEYRLAVAANLLWQARVELNESDACNE